MKTLRFVGIFLNTLVIYLGLPLLGWGLDDLRGFFSHPPLAGYSLTIAAFGMLASYLFLQPDGMGNRLGKGQESKFVPRQRLVRILVTGMLFGALLAVPYCDRRDLYSMAGSPALRWLGLALATLGMGMIFWSGAALGRLYSPEVTLQQDHHLVTAGPYRLIRHPRYLGGALQGIGLSLLFRSWIGFGLTAIFVIIVLFRIKDEEVLMSQEFGDHWKQYCHRSWRLIPFIY